MRFICLLLHSLCLGLILDPILIYGPKTTEKLLSQFPPDYQSLSIVSLSTQELSRKNFDFFIDLTQDSSFFAVFDTLSSLFDTFYLTITSNTEATCSQWRYDLHGNTNKTASALNTFVRHLNWKSFGVLAQSEYEEILLANAFMENSNSLSSPLHFYNTQITEATVNNLISKMIKAKGIRNLIIIDNGFTSPLIETSLINKKLVNVGSYLIYSTKTIYSATINGSIIVVEKGLETSKSPENYEFLSVSNVIQILINRLNSLKISKINSSGLRSVLESLYPSHNTALKFSIVNIQHSIKIIVGEIDAFSNEITLFSPVFYPGNSTLSNLTTSAAIPISIANGEYELGFIWTPYYGGLYDSVLYAVNQSNLNNGIPNFHVELISTDCGNVIYDPTWFEYCYSVLYPDLGVAYLAAYWDIGVLATLNALQGLGKNVPQISPFSMADTTNNSTTFPEFIKLTLSESQFYFAIYDFFKSLNIFSLAVIATDDEFYFPVYQLALVYLNDEGIKVVNPEDKRVFPSNYTTDDFEQYRSYFQAIKDTRCRYVLSFTGPLANVLQGFYDIGLRAGDFVTVIDPFYVTLLQGVKEPQFTKIKEMMEYSFSISYKEWNGELGESLEKIFSSMYPSITYMCMTYDTFTVVQAALNYLLIRGDDYEDPLRMEYIMRTNKVTGCLGQIYFEMNSNSRGSAKFNLQQFLFNSTSQQMYLTNNAYIDRYGSQTITIAKEFQWLNGNSAPPNFRDSSPCPFDNYQIQDSSNGNMILSIMCMIVFIITLISAFFSLKINQVSFEVLSERKLMNFADMICYSFFFFEFLQIISMGPDQNAYKYLLNNFQILISLDFNLYFQLEFKRFWILFYAIFGATFFWVLICIFFAINYKDTSDHFRVMTEFFIPIFGNIGFLPILSMLMDIFLCQRGIGSDLSQSYLDQDCTTFCYIGSHKIISILTVFLVCLFVIFVVIGRPLFENTQRSLNIRTKKLYLAILSIVQVVLVILNKILKFFSQSIQGFVCTAILVAFALFGLYLKPYNYERLNIAQFTSVCLGAWGILISAIFIDQNNLTLWIIIELIGFIAILVTGYVWTMTYPEMIYLKKGKDISTLFLFQFCEKYENFIKDSKSLNLSQIKQEKNDSQAILALSSSS